MKSLYGDAERERIKMMKLEKENGKKRGFTVGRRKYKDGTRAQR